MSGVLMCPSFVGVPEAHVLVGRSIQGRLATSAATETGTVDSERLLDPVCQSNPARRVQALVSRAAGRAHIVLAAIDVEELLRHQDDEPEADAQDRAHRSARTPRMRLTIGRPFDSSMSLSELTKRFRCDGSGCISPPSGGCPRHVFDASLKRD